MMIVLRILFPLVFLVCSISYARLPEDDESYKSGHQETPWSIKDLLYIDEEVGEEGSGAVRKSSGNYVKQQLSRRRSDADNIINQDDIEASGSGEGPFTASEDNEEVTINNNHVTNRELTFFSRPGMLAAVIGGMLHSILCAFLVVIIVIYRIKITKARTAYAVNLCTENLNCEMQA